MAARKNKKYAPAFASRFGKMVKEAQKKETRGRFDIDDDVLNFAGVTLSGSEKSVLDIVTNLIGDEEKTEFSLKDIQNRFYMRYGRSIEQEEAKNLVERMTSTRISAPQSSDGISFTIRSYLLPLESVSIDDGAVLYTVIERPVILDVTVPEEESLDAESGSEDVNDTEVTDVPEESYE